MKTRPTDNELGILPHHPVPTDNEDASRAIVRRRLYK
jgi:hypothetical protein